MAWTWPSSITGAEPRAGDIIGRWCGCRWASSHRPTNTIIQDDRRCRRPGQSRNQAKPDRSLVLGSLPGLLVLGQPVVDHFRHSVRRLIRGTQGLDSAIDCVPRLGILAEYVGALSIKLIR